MKRSSRIHVVFAPSFVILLIFGCAGPSTDPRQGGLIGGAYGLSSGKYEERVKEREKRLKKLEELQQELEKDKANLEEQKEQKSRELSDIQHQLDDLQKKSEALANEVDHFQVTLKEQEAKHNQLRMQLATLKIKIGALSEKSTRDIQVEQLEAERAVLEKEYRALLELYRELIK